MLSTIGFHAGSTVRRSIMPVTREEIATELGASDHQKALNRVRRALADLNAAERQLRAAEHKRGFLRATIVVTLMLVAGYTYRFELKDIGDRTMAQLVPGRASARGHVVEVARARSGDFYINAKVNGARVPMVFDTGASSVMLTRDAAIAAGLPDEMIKYTVNIDTANGRAHAAAAVIDRITVGGIVERSVPALIAQPGTLRTSLLGLSFLSRLQSYEVRGDRVVMRGALGSVAARSNSRAKTDTGG
jgi:clan AA aspartic protease (TIGR02281 family)